MNTCTANAAFTVHLSEASMSPVTVQYATVDGSATAGSDYQAASGTLTFNPGEVEKLVVVLVNGDTDDESNESFLVALAGATVAIVDAQAVGTIRDDDATVAAGDMRLIGYFPSWGIYQRNYQVTDIPADRLTHINYAFANISATGEIQMGDAYADPINFQRLRELKQQHPHLQTLISVGGWTWSDRFSDVALTNESRQRFVTSSVEFMQQHGFDGIDIDWEYPVAGGESDNIHRPEDRQNYTFLMQEFRRQLNDLETVTGGDYLLSIASPAGAGYYNNIELAAITEHLDFINVMTYDFHGAWSGQTNFNSALYGSSTDPGHPSLNTAAAVSGYLDAGVPADKLVVGAAFYGRGWSGVPNINNGLYQSFTGTPSGTWERGIFDYEDLEDNYLQTYTRFWHDEAQVPWLYSADTGIMISYDDPESLAIRAQYVIDNGLGGVMFWELSGDNDQHSLVTTLHGELFPTVASSTQFSTQQFVSIAQDGLTVMLHREADAFVAGQSTNLETIGPVVSVLTAQQPVTDAQTVRELNDDLVVATVDSESNIARREADDWDASSNAIDEFFAEFEVLDAMLAD